MKLKTHKVIELSNKISENYESLNQLKGPLFLYTIQENIKLLNLEINRLNKIIEGTEGYNEYQNKRIDTCVQYAHKDEEGKPKMVMNNNIEEFDIDQTEEFIKDIQNLQEEYKEDIDLFLKQVDKYNNELEKDIEIEFKTISINDIPNDINFNLMSVVNLFIENK